jgi:hypothetical protein
MDISEIREALQAKEADVKIVDWERTYFLTKYRML